MAARKKLAAIFIILIGFIVIASVFAYVRYSYEKCEDGWGSDYYFEKNELFGVGDLKAFRPKNTIAYVNQNCSKVIYKIKAGEKLKRASSYEEFDQFISNYNRNCQDCLLVYKTGWPYSGEIFKMSTNEMICNSGVRSFTDYDKCINIDDFNQKTNIPDTTESSKQQEELDSQFCNVDEDCALWMCAGICTNKEWKRTAIPDLPCATYHEYSCDCINSKCTMVK